MQSTTLGRQDFPVKSILLRWGDVGRSSVSAFAEVMAGTSEPHVSTTCISGCTLLHDRLANALRTAGHVKSGGKLSVGGRLAKIANG
jgi:hypothetical protein